MKKYLKNSKKESIKNIINIINFKKENTFSFKLTNFTKIFAGIDNFFQISPNNEDIETIKNEIYSYENLDSQNAYINDINILPIFYDGFKNLKEIPKTKSEEAVRIENFIDNYKGEKRITLKMLAKEYEKEYKKKININKISKILKNELNLHYRKTILKNPKLEEEPYILMTFSFLKAISRSLKLGLDLVFLDETGFSLDNTNLKIWRKDNDISIGGCKTNGKKRINLIMAINKKEIIYGQYYIGETISTNEFIDFLSELINRIDKKELEKVVFILDNASYHNGKKITKFIIENKLKFIYTIPYKSEYNAIEYAFNLMKNHVYNTINTNMTQLKQQIKGLIEDDKINKDINKIYKLTLKKYLDFGLNAGSNYDFNDLQKIFLNKKRK